MGCRTMGTKHWNKVKTVLFASAGLPSPKSVKELIWTICSHGGILRHWMTWFDPWSDLLFTEGGPRSSALQVPSRIAGEARDWLPLLSQPWSHRPRLLASKVTVGFMYL